MDHARARGRGVALSLVLAVLAGAFVAAATNGASAATSSSVVSAVIPSATNINATGCAAGTPTITDFGSVMPGLPAVTSNDCVVIFGSSNNTSMLRMFQADAGGDAMLPAPVGGALAMWTMNGSLEDSSATGNDGDPFPAAPEDPSFVAGGAGRGQALHLDGDDHASIPHHASYDTTSFTVDAWIRTTDSQAVIAARQTNDCGSGGICQWELYMVGGKFQPEIEVGSTWKGPTTTVSIDDGVWHHVAMTVDDATKEIRAYVDGVEDAVDSNWNAGSADTGTAGITIGQSAAGSHPFDGDLDELRHQPGVRSAADIRRYYLGRVQNYADGPMDWNSPIATTNMFGVCLHAAADGALTDLSTFVPNPGCPTTDGPGWRALAATSSDPAAKVAFSPSGDTDGAARLRFGFRSSSSQPPGAYEAPIAFEVIAPAA
jgi:hypothetical protein